MDVEELFDDVKMLEGDINELRRKIDAEFEDVLYHLDVLKSQILMVGSKKNL